jgi:1-deoxy-D-xylulose-5-phosphate reductoisomerase
MGQAFGLTFYPPDEDRFPSLRIAYDALKMGDSAQIALNSANEVAASAFMDGRIRFTDIPAVVEEALTRHPSAPVIDTVDAIWEIHKWARDYTERKIRESYD